MMVRSMMKPNAPTTSGARISEANHRLMPAFTEVITVYPPSMMNSPWARLITRIMPKITASPIDMRIRLAMEVRI